MAYVASSFFVFCSRGVTRARYSLQLSDLESTAEWLLLAAGVGTIVERRERRLRSPRDRIAAETVFLEADSAGGVVAAASSLLLLMGPASFTSSADGLPLLCIVVTERREVPAVMYSAFEFLTIFFVVLFALGGGDC